jgi:hypothetical protein
MLLRVALVRTDVSEELSASFISVKRTGNYKYVGTSHKVVSGIILPYGHLSASQSPL